MRNNVKICVDLGCGKRIYKRGTIGIDRQKFNFENFIQANYLSDEAIEKLKEKLSERKIDVLYSAYSLCFNEREKLEEYLPKYFALLSKNGEFIINDFGPSEKVVANHTHIDKMLPFFAKYFKKIRLTNEEKVSDKDHFHWIIKIILTEVNFSTITTKSNKKRRQI